MNTLVIYDSTYGNTERVAHVVADKLAKNHQVKLLLAEKAGVLDLGGIDLLVMGGPTQRHGMSLAFRDLFERIPGGTLRGIEALAFDTRFRMLRILTGSAAQDIARKLDEAGCEILLPPESFFITRSEGPLDEGELERAATWATEASNKLEERQYAKA